LHQYKLQTAKKLTNIPVRVNVIDGYFTAKANKSSTMPREAFHNMPGLPMPSGVVKALRSMVQRHAYFACFGTDSCQLIGGKSRASLGTPDIG